MNALSKDAKGFVSAIVSELSGEKKAGTASRVRDFLTRVSAQAKKEKNAIVESAVALTAEEKVRVEKLLARLLRHSVDVTYTVRASIIAGLRIRVADWVLDTSFESQLSKMRAHVSL